MIKIGILPTSQIFTDDNPYNDKYMFYNVYTRRIFEAGGVPVGILLNDGKLDVNSLEMCDAFVIGGGNKIEPYFFETIHYAITNNKPLLGICLGMQSIGLYSYLEQLLKEANQDLTEENMSKMYKKIKEDKVMFLSPVEGHYNTIITRDAYLENRHKVKIKKGTKLHSIFPKSSIDVLSMHNYAINKYGDHVLVNCSSGNVVEGLEYKDDNLYILGVQWHPEIEDETNAIFKNLVKEAERRR